MRGHKIPFAILVAAALLLGSAVSEAKDLKAIVAAMGGDACRGMPKWDCVALDVPIDHRANGGDSTKVEYAIHYATEPSKGVLFYVVGGPGESGVAEADEWLQFYSEELRSSVDIVFFDQRGIGPDRGATCPQALKRFKMAQPSIREPDKAIAIAKAYATDCPAEFKPAARAIRDFLDTDQAIHDLELFRQAIGSPQVWIYGYSYGTQFAQQYATAFPTAVRGVIIDGVVDLTLDYDQYETAAVLAGEKILTRVFEACSPSTPCGADMSGSAAVAYNSLVSRAAEKPIEVDYPQADGSLTKRQLTRNMLETAAYTALRSANERATFLRALAAASRNNLVPLLELSYSDLNLDPETLEILDDPTNYEAAYYAITCSEYGEGTADSDATARQIINRAEAFSPMAPRLLEFFYMERLVCAFWPKRGPTERPKPYVGGAFPTLIINADTDPITPLSMSESVFDHAKKASKAALIIVEGGPHVSWGYGDLCVDQPVYDLLIRGKMPVIDGNTPATKVHCPQSLIGDYTGLTLTDRTSADNAHSVAAAAETEIRMSPKLYNWTQQLNRGTVNQKDLTVGCDFGGTVTASGDKERQKYIFAGCAWWPNISLTGTGAQVSIKGGESLKLDLAITGEHSGKIIYSRDVATNAETWSGNYDGKVVSAP